MEVCRSALERRTGGGFGREEKWVERTEGAVGRGWKAKSNISVDWAGVRVDWEWTGECWGFVMGLLGVCYGFVGEGC